MPVELDSAIETAPDTVDKSHQRQTSHQACCNLPRPLFGRRARWFDGRRA